MLVHLDVHRQSYLNYFYHFSCKTGCQAVDRHNRPTFKQILEELNTMLVSSFTKTPNESFHTMQAGWKKEINEVLEDLRLKEKVKHVPFGKHNKFNLFAGN